MSMNIENKNTIGIIDMDFLSTRELRNFNFGVLLVASYYQVRGPKARLIIDLNYDNLSKYKRIFVFKSYKTKIHPINLIKDYYTLPVEEYGEGFPGRPLFPSLPEIIFTPVQTDIYKPIMEYMKQGGKKFTMSPKWQPNVHPTMLFFEQDGEILSREYPKKSRLLVYDDPLIILNTDVGLSTVKSLKSKKKAIKLVKPIRIGKVSPDLYDWLFTSRTILSFQEDLYAEDGDEYLEAFLEWCRTSNNCKETTVLIKTSVGIDRFRKRGGRIYERKTIKEFEPTAAQGQDERNFNTSGSNWDTRERRAERDREARKRDLKERRIRRRYLPSSYRKRASDRNRRFNAIKRGR